MIDVLLNWVVPMIHVLACFFLIVVVLLQTGKGADIGAVFGGGSQTLFGSGGAGNLLTKLTTGTAILFMVTSLILSYGQGRGSSSSSLLNRLPAEAPAAREVAPTPPAPAAPAPSEQAPPAGGGEGAPAGGQ